MNKFLVAILLLGLSSLVFATGETKDSLASTNVYNWQIDKVVDGDTLSVVIYPVPIEIIPNKVRIYGVDTPEHGGRAKCQKEALLAEQAILLTNKVINEAKAQNIPITFTNIANDKYAGRVLAKVWIGNKELRQYLLEAKVAVPYYGTKKFDWCNNTPK